MTIDLTQFYQVFFDETQEHLASTESLLLSLDVDAPNMDDLNAIFRAAHSIKGGAATFNFTDMAELTHVLESLLDKLRNSELLPTSDMVDLFLQAVDVLKAQLDGHRNGGDVDPQAAKAIQSQLEAMAKQKKGKAKAGRKAESNVGYGFFDNAPGLAEADSGYGFFDEAPGAPTAPAQAVVATAATSSAAASADVATIRVNLDKVDQLINMVGELVITQTMLNQISGQLDPVLTQHLFGTLGQLERNCRDLQSSVMSIRMMPINFVFSRFPRMVRDLAKKLDKEIEFKTTGDDTELDKVLIEKLADPLTHLVRNSVDHGIESPEDRVKSGKKRTGAVTLSASHQSGNILIEISDDGGGLNRDKILAKAKENGLSVSDAMSDQEVWQLIFAPGFSTAEVVSDVSGRGVGMDVVKRNIIAMGGRVDIESKFGQGTKISIRLPLTLAILDGMSIAVGDEVFIIPLNFVIESLQPGASEVKSVSGGQWVVQVRGEYVPVRPLYQLFHIKPNSPDLHQGIMVILESNGKKTALFVDDLVGQHQVVIKSLESNYRKINGVSGATIMGDGKVALILDVPALVHMAA